MRQVWRSVGFGVERHFLWVATDVDARPGQLAAVAALRQVILHDPVRLTVALLFLPAGVTDGVRPFAQGFDSFK